MKDMKAKKNPFAQKPVRVVDNGAVKLLPGFRGKVLRGEELPKYLWLIVMQYFSEKDLNMLMLTNRCIRLYAAESVLQRAKMPIVPVGAFFDVRLGFYKILLDRIQITDKKLAYAINVASRDPELQKQIFNKIPTRILAEWLGISPQKMGEFIRYMIDVVKGKDLERLKYIFKNFESLLKYLNKKNIHAVEWKVADACNPRVRGTSSDSIAYSFM